MKKILLCLVFIAAALISCAYADGEVEPTEITEHVETTDELGDVSASDPPAPIETSDSAGAADLNRGDPDNAADADITPDPDPEPASEPGISPLPTPEEETPSPVPASTPALIEEAEESPSPSPEPTPEITPGPGELTPTDMLAGIYGILIFFAVVALCYFAYKFFRIFF